MSLSTLIQKNIPALLFLLGLFFIASALYMSREFEMSYWYVLIGLAFGMYGVGIDFVRLQHRTSDQSPKTLIYNRIAETLFLLGLLLIAFALYMSREFAVSIGYVVIGLAFCAWGVGIDFVRVRHRKSHRPPNQQATQSAQ
jgi:O-antigen/teichoic acid export membrane protein